MDIKDAGLFMRVNIAALRARQIMQGASPKLYSESRKPAAIAAQEIDEDLIEVYTPAEIPASPEEEILDAEGDEEFELGET